MSVTVPFVICRDAAGLVVPIPICPELSITRNSEPTSGCPLIIRPELFALECQPVRLQS